MNRLQQMTIAAAIALGGGAASAANVIDQNAPTKVDYYPLTVFSFGDVAQSFQQSATNISGAGIFLFPNWGTTDVVTISLWDNLPNQSVAKRLATASEKGTQGTWFDVFWEPVSITPDTTYYLVFEGTTNTLAISGDPSGGGYSRGMMFSSSGYLGPFAGFPNYDHAFRTYASVPSVPEPETYALMLAGLCLVGWAARRRQQTAR